tara:strand:- start:1537 stop:1809 length:273 start_codon:yes stop_codon:yes gene_type:complete
MTKVKHNKYFVWQKKDKHLRVSFWGFQRNITVYVIWDKVFWINVTMSNNIFKCLDEDFLIDLRYKTLIDFDSRQFIQLNDNLDKRGTEND